MLSKLWKSGRNDTFKSWIDICIVFFVCFIPKFLIAKDQIMINTLSDEVSSMSIAAFLAGYDWRDVISNAGYYGIGYLFIFAPLFKLGLPAMQIYRIILSVNAVLIGLSGVICYQIQKNIFKIESRMAKIAIACTCGCMSIFSTSISRARNEDIFLLCGWLIAYVVLKLFECNEDKKKKKYELQLIMVILYMLTIHSRSFVYIISLIIVSVLYYLSFHKTILSKESWCFLVIGYLGVQQILGLYQNWVWQSESVRNASVGNTVSTAISKITIDMSMVKSVLMIIFGQFFTAFSLSGGLFLISFVLIVFLGYRCLKNKAKLENIDNQLWWLAILYVFSILVSIGGQSIIWGVNVYKGIISGSVEYIYAYKAFTYMRYMGSYVPQFTMIALVVAWRNMELWKRACRVAMALYVPLFLFWDEYIIPFVKNTKSNMEFFLTIVSLPWEVENDINTWNIMFLTLFIFVFIWMFKADRKTFVWKLLIIGVFYTSIERTTIFYNKILFSEEKYLDRINEGCEVIEVLHNRLLEDESSICVVDATINRTDHQNWYLYQFLNYDLHIIPATKETVQKTELIFSTHSMKDILNNEYDEFRLDKNEYLYSKNPEYSMEVRNMGY